MIFELMKNEDGEMTLFRFPTKEAWVKNEEKNNEGVEVALGDYLKLFVVEGESGPQYLEDSLPFRMIIEGKIISPSPKTVIKTVELS